MSAQQSPAFDTEAALVEQFVDQLAAGTTTFGGVQVTREWDHRSGFVDVLARDGAGQLIAFEAKLTDWRRAYHQAYRNTAYAHKAYILLPESVARRALKHRDDFEQRGIGLCAMQADGVQILVDAAEQDPLMKWLRAKAHEYFDLTAHDRADQPAAANCCAAV